MTTITTRAMREGEKDGVDFHFVTRKEFEKIRDNGELIEWSEHFGSYYGTRRSDIDTFLSEYNTVFAILDINGARQVLEKMPDALTIFIKPADLEDIKRRLEERGVGTKEERLERFLRVIEEINAAPEFHHTVINVDGEFEKTVSEVLGIVRDCS